MKIRELTTWNVLCKGEPYAWVKSSVTYDVLKANGVCFHAHSPQPGVLIEFYKYGRNVFKVVY